MVEVRQHFDRAKKLFDQGLYASAELMLGVVLSRLPTLLTSLDVIKKKTADESPERCFESDAYMLFADCLFQRHEYRRAMGYYAKALQRLKLARNTIKSTPLVTIEYTLREKYAESCIKVQEFAMAKSLLEPIPVLSRTVSIHLKMAKIYEHLADHPAAMDCYHHISRLEPDAIEAHLALVRLNAPLGQILAHIQTDEDVGSHKRSVTDPKQSDDWMNHYIIACHFQKTCRYQDALELFTVLESKFRENTDILLHMAACHAKNNNPTHAYYIYSQVRKIEPDRIDQMDQFADLIKNQGKSMLVGKLADDLLRIQPNRPECWVALGRYCEMKNDFDKAFYFAEKALESDKSHIEAYKLKGACLFALERPSEALAVYRVCSRFTQDLFVFKGIMESYVVMGKYKEALVVAREALKLMPHDAKALTLVGMVLSKTEGNHDQAVTLFEKALEKDPKCHDALLALASLYMTRNHIQKAITLLESHVRHQHADTIHARLGQTYLLIKDYTRAMTSFHQALRINPDCQMAQQGLQTLEQNVSLQDANNTGPGFMGP